MTPFPLRSAQFDDVYFSAEDGLGETRHVFLDGVGAPDLWNGKDGTVIYETGFGTGLNFLALWALFEATAAPGQSLDFISFEKYPLRPEVIGPALERWREDLGPARLSTFLEAGASDFALVRPAGGTVRLKIVAGDVNDTLPGFEGALADAWFLDGFSPTKNPQMWTDLLYAHMARLSRPGTRLASFTAAGHVRRGLAGVGFRVEKAPGFGRKRHMIRGCFAPERLGPF